MHNYESPYVAVMTRATLVNTCTHTAFDISSGKYPPVNQQCKKLMTFVINGSVVLAYSKSNQVNCNNNFTVIN